MQDLKHRVLDGIALSLEEWTGEREGQVGDMQATTWNKLALEGRWDGHAMGPFSLNKAMFEQMAQHHAALGTDTVVDYEHSSLGGIFGGGEAPAAGWITDMEARKGEDGESTLWGRVVWTKKAAAHIAAKEYRYLSPTIVFNTKDRRSGDLTGASLHSVALTNVPFLDELPEIRLNSLRRAFEIETETKERDAMDEKQLTELASVLGLPADTKPEDVIAALKAHKAASDEITAAHKTANETLATLEAEKAEIKTAALMDQAQRDGKVIGANKEWAATYAAKDPSGFEAWMDSAPDLGPLQAKKPPTTETPIVSVPEGISRGCQALGLTAEQFSKWNEGGEK